MDEAQINAAMDAGNLERLRQLLAPPRLGVLVKDDIVHNML